MVAAPVEAEISLPPPAFRPKRGSVFPAKRKLVKTMMVELIVETFLSFFIKVHPNRTFQKKNKNTHHVFPL